MELKYWKWLEEGIALSFRNVESVNHLVLGDQVLWLGRRWSIGMSGSGGCFGSKDILFENNFLDELFQVFSDCSAMDGLVSLVIIVGAIFFYFGKRWNVSD